jgi:hypothetical protein
LAAVVDGEGVPVQAAQEIAAIRENERRLMTWGMAMIGTGGRVQETTDRALPVSAARSEQEDVVEGVRPGRDPEAPCHV